MIKKLIVILVMLLFFPIVVVAKSCNENQISSEKALANRINWAYEYYVKNNKMYFDVIVTNVFEDLYVKNTQNGSKYYKKEFVLKGLTDNQKMTFEIYSKNCNTVISVKELYLPKYNTFYGTDYCKGISEFSYCGKWNDLGDSISLNDLKAETNKYRENLNKDRVVPVQYETNITGFYSFIILIFFSLSLLLIFLQVGKIKKDFI